MPDGTSCAAAAAACHDALSGFSSVCTVNVRSKPHVLCIRTFVVKLEIAESSGMLMSQYSTLFPLALW